MICCTLFPNTDRILCVFWLSCELFTKNHFASAKAITWITADCTRVLLMKDKYYKVIASFITCTKDSRLRVRPILSFCCVHLSLICGLHMIYEHGTLFFLLFLILSFLSLLISSVVLTQMQTERKTKKRKCIKTECISSAVLPYGKVTTEPQCCRTGIFRLFKTAVNLEAENDMPFVGQHNKWFSVQVFWEILFLTGIEYENIQANIPAEKQIAWGRIPLLNESLRTFRKIPVPVMSVEIKWF